MRNVQTPKIPVTLVMLVPSQENRALVPAQKCYKFTAELLQPGQIGAVLSELELDFA